MNSEDEYGNNLSGFFSRGRMQGKCQIVFQNGDEFIGKFLDGKPNGKGEIKYKKSIAMQNAYGINSQEFEQAVYRGNF